MQQKIFQIDAFTSDIFRGNPAAVCPLERWLSDDILQAIATENNLSETAFFIEVDGGYQIRWFTPSTEVDLCGHATLAAAWVLVNELSFSSAEITFFSRSGALFVSHNEGKFTLDFPEKPAFQCDIPAQLASALQVPIQQVLKAEDYLVIIESESLVRDLSPDFMKLKDLPLRGVIVTSPGIEVDFVSRWFGPNVGVDEDPVTGSSHTSLAPYWAKKLNKKCLVARQVSQRGGELECEVKKDRVLISGYAVKFLEGTIYL